MTDFPPDPTAETQVHIPEFKREPGGSLPWLGLIVIAVLVIAGIALIAFAIVYGQNETENRAINASVAAALAYTRTPANTRPPTTTPFPTAAPTLTAAPTAPPTATAVSATTVPPTAAPTNTQRPAPIIVPTDTPVPPTNTPVPAVAYGVTGQLTLCNPEKPSFAAEIERICFREKIVNTTGQTIAYGVLGVQVTSLSGGPNKFHSSWQGNLSIGPGCTGPTDSCGGPWEDGMKIATPGTYRLALSMCFSEINACLGGSGDWETFAPAVEVTVVSWTPSP